MNINIFIRNVQLYKLGIGELNGRDKKIYNFLVDNLTGLCVYTSDKKPNYLYFGKTIDTIVLSYDSKNQILYIDYDKIWSFFNDNLSMGYVDLESLMRWWVGGGLNLKPKHINELFHYNNMSVGGGLNLKPKHIDYGRNTL